MDSIFTNEVVWFLIGMVLLLAELILPGLIVLFFGVGAWITALCCMFWDISLEVQLIIFLLSSIVTLALLRRLLRKKYMKTREGESAEMEDEYIGKTAAVLEDFDSNGMGKVSFKGAVWTAFSAQPVVKGQTVRITGFESVKLIVEPLK